MTGISDILIVVSTLSIYSVLYKENPFSVWAENTFVGMAQAFAFVVAINYVKDYAITPMMQGSYLGVVPVLVGLLAYFRFTKNYRWLARFPISISIGVGMGTGLRALMQVSFLSQITATILPLFVFGDIIKTLGNIVIIVAVVSTLSFFYFSRPHTGVLGGTTRIAHYLLYVAFGVYFGNVYMGRVGLFNGRMSAILAPQTLLVTLIVAPMIILLTYFLSRKGFMKRIIGY